jgi:hypothetical protein
MGRNALYKTAFTLVLFAALPLSAREKDGIQYGSGLIVNVPFSANEVEQVVQEVAQNGIIRGTKEYNKDEYVTGATEAKTTRAFKEWTEGGKAFYKLRLNALDPQNFKNTNDVGTLAVRYIVQGQDDKHTVLRIDAVFVEDFRHATHASNGSVEGAEYKTIHDRLDAIDLMKAQTAEAERAKQARIENKQAPGVAAPEFSSSKPQSEFMSAAGSEVSPPAATVAPAQSLEQHVRDLRQQVERLVKAPGAPLKAAPFHTASTLQSLPSGTEVLVVISTPYWFGVETHDGKHGWLLRDQLEPIP